MRTLTYQTYLEAEKTQQLTLFFKCCLPLPLQHYTVTASFCHLVSLAYLLSLNSLALEAFCCVIYALCCQIY